MTGTKYLSDVLDIDLLKPNVLNIIEADTGSGKTYCAIHKIGSSASDRSKVLYLVDTLNVKSEVLKYPETKNYDEFWHDVISGDNFISNEFNKDKTVVITYGKLGSMKNIDIDFLNYFEYIICDELHSLMDYIKYENNKHALMAKQIIEASVKLTKSIVVAMTATPNALRSMNCSKRIVPIDLSDIRRYETKSIIRYSSIHDLIKNKIDKKKKGILYNPYIRTMEKYGKYANQCGSASICIWSETPKDKNKMMIREQLEARQYLIQRESIMPPYNLLIINASSGTGITIDDDIEYMICDRTNEDDKIQFRGRLRRDLNTLYWLEEKEKQKKQELVIPTEYLDKWLSPDLKAELCLILSVPSANGKPHKWSKELKTKICEAGYLITSKRTKPSPDEKIAHCDMITKK